MRQTGLDLGSLAAALGVNVLIFSSFLFMGMSDPSEKDDDSEKIRVEMVDLSKLGEVKTTKTAEMTVDQKKSTKASPNLLPDKIEPLPQPAPPEKKITSLSRKKKEDFEKPKPKPKPPEAKEKPKPKKPPKKTPKKKENKTKVTPRPPKVPDKTAKKKKQRDLENAQKIKDAFADLEQSEDVPEGRRDGHELGESLREAKNEYGALLRLLMSRQFRVPAAMSNAELARLKAKVSFQINARGKVRNIQLDVPSRNALFDQAASAAVKRFLSTGPATLGPPPEKIRATILDGKARVVVVFEGKNLANQRK